jgi:hypothetical protein
VYPPCCFPSADGAAAAAAAEAPDTAALDTAAGTTVTAKRQRGGSSSGPQAPPALSCKREALLFTGALEDALLALKARLPAGYFQVQQNRQTAAEVQCSASRDVHVFELATTSLGQ